MGNKTFDDSEEPLMNHAEVCEFLRVSSQMLYKLVRSGQVPALRVGTMYRYQRSELMEYLRINRNS